MTAQPDTLSAAAAPPSQLQSDGRPEPAAAVQDVDDESLYAVGHHLYAQARYDLALPVFGLLLLRDSLERRYLSAFAACLQMQGRPEAALPHYLTAAVLDPNDPVPVFHACECLVATGRQAEAREGLHKLQAVCQPVVHDALQKKAQALLELMATSSTSVHPGKKHDANCH